MTVHMRTAHIRTRGFTLLELLITIGVLAILSLLSWRGLESLVGTRDRLLPRGADLRAQLAVFGQLERDLAQAAPPALTGSRSATVQVSGNSDGQVLEIQRLRPSAATGAAQLQTVRYRVQEGKLLRQTARADTSAAGAAGDEAPTPLAAVTLLDAVRTVRFRLWREGSGWLEPGADTTTRVPVPGQSPLNPPGVEVLLERPDGSLLRRVLLVG
jgi:general secretion pathway protein J